MRGGVVVSLLCALAAGGCAARQGAPPTRETAAGTVEMFKLHARQGDRAGEWDILSPGLKQRFSQRAGRQLDAADYVQARNAYRNDPQAKLAEQMLQTAIVRREEPAGPNAVWATIVTSGGPFGRSARIKMVKLDIWELRVAGEPEPYTGQVGDPTFGVEKRPDGSYDVIYRAGPGAEEQRTNVPASQVLGYRVTSKWYVDDLGELENQFVQ